ncbi:hypothetical protein DRE_03542 [Drechslerella stenobrocha 248]|uniref:carnosine N-methyltransferase n=1 Tax=Drechslerella stenobrocha 248 TaxID=1043628 RepID=W7I4T4_9PEZI|nr:hypothetical protein DRE_03542 [Drechslerella stenobrocha 248]
MDIYTRIRDFKAENFGRPGIADPNSPDEQNVLFAALASFYLYRRAAHFTFTHRRRRNLYSLPLAQQQILVGLNFQPVLDQIDECIENNATFAEAILKSGCASFGIDASKAEQWKNLVDNSDMDKARSTIKQFLRDWSEEGAAERDQCYGPILTAIDKYFGKVLPLCETKILVPGAGLGRLAFEICKRGYSTEGNEFSYHQLLASNFILNGTEEADQYTIHPFCLGFSNHRSRENQTRAVTIPDVHPGTELFKTIEYTITEKTESLEPGVYHYRPSQFFSMSAGEFIDSYNTVESKESFDCVATCFFLDTARNVLQYLETIRHILVEGGIWINNGPLLWHWEGQDASEGREAWGGKKGEVKSFNEAQNQSEEAETPMLPSVGPQPRPGGHDNRPEHLHHHLGPSGFSRPISHAQSHSTTSNSSFDWRGSLEFTLEEIYQLMGMYGFEIIEQGSGKTGYIEDNKNMARYIYEPEYWVAVKTDKVSDLVAASFKPKDSSGDGMHDVGGGDERGGDNNEEKWGGRDAASA